MPEANPGSPSQERTSLLDNLIAADGASGEKLMEEMKKHIVPVAQHQAKTLDKEGRNTKGGALTYTLKCGGTAAETRCRESPAHV